METHEAHRGGGEWRISVNGDAGMDFGDRIAWIEEFPGVTQEEHVRRFTGFVNARLAGDPEFDGVYPEYASTIRYLPGSATDLEHPFFSVLASAFGDAGKEYRLGGAPFAADTYVFNLYSSTPVITLGPGGGNAHAADEHVLVDDVVDLVRIYARAILVWCA
jgi:acetylornithine deacetylase